jgi:hypothetical protein
MRGVGAVLILSLLAAITLLAALFTSYLQQSRSVVEKTLLTQLERARAALLGYAKANGCRLPLPTGLRSDGSPDNQQKTGGSSGLWVGLLPVRDLGLEAGSTTLTDTAPLWYVVYCPDANCTQSGDTLTVRSSSDSVTAVNARNAVFAVLAPGPARDTAQAQSRASTVGTAAVPIAAFLENAVGAGTGMLRETGLLNPVAATAGAFVPVMTPPSLWRTPQDGGMSVRQYNDVGVFASYSDLGCASGGLGTNTIDLNDVGPDATPIHQGFVTEGAGAAVIASDPAHNDQPTLAMNSANGSSGSCLWFDPLAVGFTAPIPFRGKRWEGTFRYQFAYPDPPGGVDRRYGFTFALSDSAAGRPTTCGAQQNMGVIIRGSTRTRYFLEVDVHTDVADSDPNGNHLAWKYDADLTHAGGNGAPLASGCSGSSQPGCVPAPANAFEEQPNPQAHRIHFVLDARCNADCSDCSGTSTAAVLAQAWLDCADASGSDPYLCSGQAPSLSACYAIAPSEMDGAYFGFTGGWGSGANAQGVTLWDFRMRWQ